MEIENIKFEFLERAKNKFGVNGEKFLSGRFSTLKSKLISNLNISKESIFEQECIDIINDILNENGNGKNLKQTNKELLIENIKPLIQNLKDQYFK